MNRVVRFIDAIGNELFHVAGELAGLLDVVKIHRRAKRRQIVITLTMPELARTFTFLLLAIGIGGIAYVVTPLTATKAVISDKPVTAVASTITNPSDGLDRSAYQAW